MTKWEYCTLFFSNQAVLLHIMTPQGLKTQQLKDSGMFGKGWKYCEGSAPFIAQLGEEGWELVSIAQGEDVKGLQYWTFKRPIEK